MITPLPLNTRGEQVEVGAGGNKIVGADCIANEFDETEAVPHSLATVNCT